MALVLADRVRETTTTAGTGTITLLGAVPSCQSFAVIGNGNTTYYTIVAYTGTEYEVGIGTYTSSGTTLSRDTVLASSNGGSLVNFSAGTKDVFCDYPAGKAVTTDTLAYPPAIGGTTPAAGTFTTLTATGQTRLSTTSGSTSVGDTSTAGKFGVKLDTGYTLGSGWDSKTAIFGNINTASGAGSGALGFAFDTSSGATITAIAPGVSWYPIRYAASVHQFSNQGVEQARVSHTASAVNYHQLTGSATGSGPIHSVAGSDTNIDLNLTTKGTGVVNLNTGSGAQARIIDIGDGTRPLQINGGSAAGAQIPGITATAVLAISAGGGNPIRFYTNGRVTTQQAEIAHTASAVNYVELTGAPTNNAPTIGSRGSDTNINFAYSSKGTGGHDFYTAGTSFARQFTVANTASAVNYVQVTGSATLTGGPTLSAQGSDFNIPLRLQSKGISAVELGNPAGWAGFTVTTTNNPNRIALNAPATGFIPTFTTAGVDTNAGMAFISKGTGAIDLAAGSSGVNISNGGTVTAITRTAAGSAYTSIPSVAISAPTTAGGVQSTATAIVQIRQTSGVTINSGGTGYTVGDTLTVVGGTGTAAQFTVATVSSGVITTITLAIGGAYSALPTFPASVSGGTGSSATFTFTDMSLSATPVTITNAGSGYVEQPTVTFSGGGGSGAAAFAIVGSGTTIKSLGSTLSFVTPSGEQARISDTVSAVNYIQLTGGASGATPAISIQGTGTNVNVSVSSKGTGAVRFFTNNTSQEQLAVSHTASAVNYVQVTGAATGGVPIISSQGSDTNVQLRLVSKGSQGITFFARGGSAQQFSISSVNSSVNYLSVDGAVTGFGPVLSSQGSDTNIPLVLQPKGTGALQAQQTDSTATGGNARGTNAVDWQTFRDSASKVASGAQSVVGGGQYNQASGGQSVVAGGSNVVSSGLKSASVGGENNTNAGQLAFLGGGYFQTLSSNGQFGFLGGGYLNTLAGFYNVIGGGFTNSGTSGSAVTTQSATMNATTAVTLSGSNANIKVGQLITGTSITNFPNTYVAAISGTSLTLSQAASGSSTSTLSFYTPHGVVVGGGNNQATGSYSFIGGGGDAGTAANRNVASGDWSFVGGGSKNVASGIASVIAGGGVEFGTNFGNTASGSSSFIGSGILNIASGIGSSVTGGWQNSANGTLSTVIGGRFGVARSIVGNTVFPANNDVFSGGTFGNIQTAVLVIGRQTTNATPAVLSSDANAASNNNQVILPNNSAYYFKGSVIANVTGAANGASWSFEGAIMRGANAGSTVLIGTPAINRVAATAGATAWVIALTADTTNGGLAVTVTGAASTTIRWVCKAETTETTF